MSESDAESENAAVSDFEVGMDVEVTIVEERYGDGPDAGIERIERTDEGVIEAVPSQKFDWPEDNFDFDYAVKTPAGRGAVRSVDLDAGKVAQLLYDGGGDREWDTFELEDMSVVGE